jgi:hypothetical protein
MVSKHAFYHQPLESATGSLAYTFAVQRGCYVRIDACLSTTGDAFTFA